MSVAGTVIVVGGLVSSQIQSNASSKASKTQAESAEAAAQAQMYGADRAAGATIGAAQIGAGATISAARLAAEATKYGADIQWKMYEQARQDQLPWLKAGTKALGELEKRVYAGPGEFTESPGYEFRLEQGNKNILSNQAATGNLASGRTLKALQEYGQDYASNEYSNFLNQYYQSLSPFQSLAGVGQSTATSMGGQAISTGQGIAGSYNNLAGIYQNQGNAIAGIYGRMGSNLSSIYQSQGNAIAQNYMNQGNIAAANSINQSNIWSNAIGGVANAAGYFLGQNSASNPYSYNSGYSYNPAPISSSSAQYLPYNF